MQQCNEMFCAEWMHCLNYGNPTAEDAERAISAKLLRPRSPHTPSLLQVSWECRLEYNFRLYVCERNKQWTLCRRESNAQWAQKSQITFTLWWLIKGPVWKLFSTLKSILLKTCFAYKELCGYIVQMCKGFSLAVLKVPFFERWESIVFLNQLDNIWSVCISKHFGTCASDQYVCVAMKSLFGHALPK